MTFRNLDQFSVLAAAAVLTERVRLMTSITILPAHPAALVAERPAPFDVLSDGRFVLGVGVGGRPHDYQAAERGMEHRHQVLDDQVAHCAHLVGRAAVRAGGSGRPSPGAAGWTARHCSALGPKAVARAAQWADGYSGVAMVPCSAHRHAAAPGLGRRRSRHTALPVHDDVRLARRRGGPEVGRFMTGYMVGFGAAADEARDAMRASAPDSAAEAMVDSMVTSGGAITDEDTMKSTIDAVHAAGYDELHFCVTTHELAELERIQRCSTASSRRLLIEHHGLVTDGEHPVLEVGPNGVGEHDTLEVTTLTDEFLHRFAV